jgi:hypothetical protein
MLYFAVPLTVITLAIVAMREIRTRRQIRS